MVLKYVHIGLKKSKNVDIVFNLFESLVYPKGFTKIAQIQIKTVLLK